MTKDEAQKAVGDMQRKCMDIYDNLFAKQGRECPDSLQEIYRQTGVLSGTIDSLPNPAPAADATATGA